MEKEKEKENISNKLAAYLTIIFSTVAIVVTIIIFHQSTTLSADKRVYFTGVLAVCGLGLYAVIFVSRAHGDALVIFCMLANFISGLTLGLAINYT